MDILLYSVAIIALIAIFVFATFVWTVMGIRLKRGTCEVSSAEEIPEYLRILFEDYAHWLSNIGFQHSHYQRFDLPIVNEYSFKYAAVMMQKEQKSYAIIMPSDLPEPGSACNIEFLTLFTDGTRLMTVNNLMHRLMGEFPDSIMADPYAETPDLQWNAHLAKLENLSGKTRADILSPEDLVDNTRVFLNKYIDNLDTKKAIVKNRDDISYSLSFPFALALASKMASGEQKSAELKRRMQKLGEPNPYRVPPDLEVESYNRLAFTSSHRKAMGWLGKFLLLGITIMLFAFSFGYFRSIEGVIIIIAVLLVHELGHLAGMHLFKYKDVKILFLPFIGAATMGSRRDAKPHERIIISFLGPAPGIAMGMALFLLIPGISGYLKETALMLLILNYLNLLPIMPLDGGQVFNVFMARFPYVQTIFQSLSALILALIFGVAINNTFFTFLGFFLFFGAMSSLPVCALLGRLRENTKRFGESISDRDLLRETFILMKEKPFSLYSFTRKFQVAKSIVESYSVAMPSIWLIVGGTVFYVALFAVPLIIYILFLVIWHLH